jgi:hypothetical protein
MRISEAYALGRDLILSALFLPVLAFAWWTWGPYPEHEDLTSKAVDIAIVRWPEMTTELNQYRDRIVQGSHDEDFGEDTLYGASTDYSGYNPQVPEAWWPTAQLPLNALQWTRAWQNPYSWDAALSLYGTNLGAAYLALGHVAHNLEDLYVPAHSFIAPHGSGTSGLVENHSWPLYFDNFEQYDEVTENELGRADPNRIPEDITAPETLMTRAAVFATTDQESLGYYPNQYYAAPDYAGDWGKYRPYPYEGYPCGEDRIDNGLANAWSLFIVPRCVEGNAALLRLFFVLNHTGIKQAPGFPPRAMKIAAEPSVFRGWTEIRYQAPAEQNVLVLIADAAGRTVKVLLRERVSPGARSLIWSGDDSSGAPVPAGRYFCVLQGENQRQVSRLVKLR